VKPEAIAAVEAIVKENHRVTVNKIAHNQTHRKMKSLFTFVFNKLRDKNI